tara:strand:+ start:870 stop:1580 length:711 start_codon:yes stop_codon:yes gene_type:complete
MAFTNISPYTNGTTHALGSINRGPVGSWNPGVRSQTTGTNVVTSGTTNKDIWVKVLLGSRGTSYWLSRAYVWYDTSAYAGSITSLEINVNSISNSSVPIDVICVPSTAFSNNTTSTLSLSDYGSMNFAVAYSSTTSWQNTTGTWQIPLNAAAVTAANTGKIGISIINENWDYQDVDPNAGFSFDWWDTIDYSQPSKFSLATTYSSGYGNTVNNVAPTSIGQINLVNSADISQINGI